MSSLQRETNNLEITWHFVSVKWWAAERNFAIFEASMLCLKSKFLISLEWLRWYKRMQLTVTLNNMYNGELLCHNAIKYMNSENITIMHWPSHSHDVHMYLKSQYRTLSHYMYLFQTYFMFTSNLQNIASKVFCLPVVLRGAMLRSKQAKLYTALTTHGYLLLLTWGSFLGPWVAVDNPSVISLPAVPVVSSLLFQSLVSQYPHFCHVILLETWTNTHRRKYCCWEIVKVWYWVVIRAL